MERKLVSDVLKILYNQLLSLNTAGHTTSRSAAFLNVLCLAAPWRIAALPAGTRQRLCVLPHQTQQSKACLMLKLPKGGMPLLMIEATASNKLFPHVAWQRPTYLDLLRFRLL